MRVELAGLRVEHCTAGGSLGCCHIGMVLSAYDQIARMCQDAHNPLT
jgi:hypothetical protein